MSLGTASRRTPCTPLMGDSEEQGGTLHGRMPRPKGVRAQESPLNYCRRHGTTTGREGPSGPTTTKSDGASKRI